MIDIDVKKLEQAADDELEFQFSGYIPSRIDFEEGFMQGYLYAVNKVKAEGIRGKSRLAREIYRNVFSSLWHNGSEKPKLYNKWIIIKYDNFDYVGTHQVRKYGHWENMVKSWPSFHWAYIDDFIPKEGDEE